MQAVTSTLLVPVPLQLVNVEGFWQGESTQAELQKAQTQLQTLSEQLQQALEQAEKQREGLESKLQLHVQEESGLIATLAEDFDLSQELQQRLTVEGGAHASAIQELRDQVSAVLSVLHVTAEVSLQVAGCCCKAAAA